MASYTDELETMREAEAALRRQIAQQIASEQGAGGPITGEPGEPGTEASARWSEAADAAIEAWGESGEDDHDLRAFRPLTPLQTLLRDHSALCERIDDLRDRRLS